MANSNSKLWTLTAAGGAVIVVICFVFWWKMPITDSKQPTTTEEAGELPTLVAPYQRAALEAQNTNVDPATSGWQSEMVADAITKQASILGKLVKSGKQISSSDIQQIATKDVTTTDLRIVDRTLKRGQLTIFRSEETARATSAGIDALVDAVNGLISPFADAEQTRVKLKVIATDIAATDGAVNNVDSGAANAKIVYEASGVNKQGRFEQHAVWQSKWDATQTAPKLHRLELLQFEETQSATDQPWFTDRTNDALGRDEAFREQVVYGLPHWLRRVERIHGMLYFKRQGLAIGDANGDGLDDVYLCQPGGLPNRLFLHQPDGSAVDVAAEYGVDFLDLTGSALFVDLDNDGDQDLVLATFEGLQLLEQTAEGQFSRRQLHRLRDTDLQAISAADFDVDGDLDVYVTVDFSERDAHANEGLPGFLYHDANEGGANVLFENNGDWQFTDVTVKSGLDKHNRRHSLAAVWEDYDNDGDPDLYVANDYGKNCLYQNQLFPSGKPRFEEIAESIGLVDTASGMSVAWGDPNRDGALDLYVANMFSSAGSRITRQSQFLPKSSDDLRAVYQRFAKGNSLFLASKDGFVENSAKANVDRARWAWSSPFVDINNDGWEDLVVANGYITTDDTGDL